MIGDDDAAAGHVRDRAVGPCISRTCNERRDARDKCSRSPPGYFALNQNEFSTSRTDFALVTCVLASAMLDAVSSILYVIFN
jgi:hypothetical protein